MPLSEGQNIDLLEEIVADQRQLLMDVFNTTDVSAIPQVWTLCNSSSKVTRLERALIRYGSYETQTRKWRVTMTMACGFRTMSFCCGPTISTFLTS